MFFNTPAGAANAGRAVLLRAREATSARDLEILLMGDFLELVGENRTDAYNKSINGKLDRYGLPQSEPTVRRWSLQIRPFLLNWPKFGGKMRLRPAPSGTFAR